MPTKETIQKAQRDKRQGKSVSTQAGEFVHEQIDKIREGKHGARSTKQAIAIGLSEARRAGVKLKPPRKGEASERTRRQAARDVSEGSKRKARPSSKRSRATLGALKREGRKAASKQSLSRQARSAAARRSKAAR